MTVDLGLQRAAIASEIAVGVGRNNLHGPDWPAREPAVAIPAARTVVVAVPSATSLALAVDAPLPIAVDPSNAALVLLPIAQALLPAAEAPLPNAQLLAPAALDPVPMATPLVPPAVEPLPRAMELVPDDKNSSIGSRAAIFPAASEVTANFAPDCAALLAAEANPLMV